MATTDFDRIFGTTFEEQFARPMREYMSQPITKSPLYGLVLRTRYPHHVWRVRDDVLPVRPKRRTLWQRVWGTR